MDLEDEVARIAEEFKDRQKQRATMGDREGRAIDITEEKHREFVEKAVAEPVRKIVEAFMRHGLDARVTILRDRVIGTVEGKSYAVHVEFQGAEPVTYDSYTPEPPRAIARRDVRGLTAERLADLISSQFVEYMREVLRT